jgi:hypothetical protein
VSLRSLLFVLPLSLGCTVYTIPAPLSITTKPLPELAAVGGKEVRGKSCGRVLLMFIPIGYSNVAAAWEEALEGAPGADTIVRYETRVTDVFFSPLYGQFCTEIHGYAVSSKELGAEQRAGD